MAMISGGQLAVDALIEKGVTKVFSLSGGHINPLYESAEGSLLEIFTTRHDQASVFMAEAWGKLTRRPGVALVTAGPGFSNSISAIANAQMANSPLLLIAGVVGLKAKEKPSLRFVPSVRGRQATRDFGQRITTAAMSLLKRPRF